MGSGGSKVRATAAAADAGGARKAKARGARMLRSSCFGRSPTLHEEQKDGEIARSHDVGSTVQDDGKTEEENRDTYQKHGPSPSEMPAFTSADAEPSEEEQDRTFLNNVGAAISSSSAARAAVSGSVNPPGRSQPCFGLIPDGISLMLNRAVSLGSSSSCPLLADGLPVPTSDGGQHVHAESGSSLEGNHSVVNAPVETESSVGAIRYVIRDETFPGRHAQRSPTQPRIDEPRRSCRRLGGPQEPFEGSVRFSRTLSVGRLRDRVLRRNPFSERLSTPSLLEGRSIWSAGQANARRPVGISRRTRSSFSRVAELQPDSSGNDPYQIASSADGNSYHGSETLPLREASNRNLLEHRSAFLERRRRIRSQVRALQRLGSRFENLSGHDRSCILSGQHRTGRCSCRTSSRAGNSDEETSTRASISRIVMLAEALFEVLDEIHQQSVVLSSRPSFSSIGSVPAPNEVVDCLPVKVYKKSTKHQHDEVSQCYICLVEYEEGDCVRILPCNHEFHQTCVDKWLKEIHRVCPLCRGDVCRPETSSMGNQTVRT